MSTENTINVAKSELNTPPTDTLFLPETPANKNNSTYFPPMIAANKTQT